MALRELLFEINLKENATDFLKKIDKGFDGLKGKIPKTTKEIEEMAGKMDKLGTSLTTKLTLPIAGLGVAAAKMSIDFENSLAKVSTIADNTAVSMSKMSKDIINLSNETGIAATDLAEDIYNAISAGQSTADAVNFVESASKLAKAGFAESAQSLDILTTTLNAYGMASEEVGKVSDILIQIQNKGKTTVGELSSSMGRAIPTAKAFGVNLEQLGAGYALMTSKGIATAETTTYISSLMNELGKSSTISAKKLKELSGKTFKTLMSEGKDLGYVLNLMNEDAVKAGVSLADMFGSAEAGKAALILAENGGKDFTNMLGNMQNAIGSTDEAFAKVTDTAGFRFNKSMNELKNTMIGFGDEISPLIDKVSDFASKTADFINNLSPAQQQNLLLFGAGLAVLGPTLTIASKAMALYAAITTAGFIPAIFTAIGATYGFTVALLANPITWVIAGLVGLGVALWKLGTNWQQVTDFLKMQTDRVRADFTDVTNRIKALFASINLFEAGANIIRGLVNGISSMAGELWATVTNIANGVAEKFKNFFGIASPSKLMFEYGGYIGQGLDLGMQSTESNVKNTAESMGQSTETGLVGSVTNSSNSFAPVVNITVNGSGGGARETASSVRKEVESVLSAYEKKMMLRWGAVNG